MSDEAQQRMTALKRAYADIIFNTTEESATRILASERRALQLQKNLSLVKEESLAMLLRLKAIMEAKITESERANLSQVKKIQELEVELREANDMIHNLKSEVRRLNSELDNQSDIETKFFDEKRSGSSVSCKKYNIREDIYKSDSCLQSPNGHKIIKNSSCYFTKDVMRHEPMRNLVSSNHYGGNLDFASMTQSNKEPEFYRDGCIHRAQAFEEIHDQESNSTTMCVNRKAEVVFPKKFGTTKKRLRRRNTKQRKFIMWPPSSDTLHDMHPRGLLKSSYSMVRQSDLDRSAENMHRNGRIASPNCSAQMPGEDKESVENQKTNLNRSFRKNNLGLSNGNGVMSSGTILKPCNSFTENYIPRSYTSSSGTALQENGLKEPLIMNARVLIDDSVSDDAKNGRTTEQKMSAKSYCNVKQNLDTSATKEETTNAPPSDHKDESCKPTESDVVEGDKLLKYTFQRKRKRGCLDSKVGSKSLEENADKVNVENMSLRDMNKENVSTIKIDNDNILVNHKSSMVLESPRDSRRMAQVARQLIEYCDGFNFCDIPRLTHSFPCLRGEDGRSTVLSKMKLIFDDDRGQLFILQIPYSISMRPPPNELMQKTMMRLIEARAEKEKKKRKRTESTTHSPTPSPNLSPRQLLCLRKNMISWIFLIYPSLLLLRGGHRGCWRVLPLIFNLDLFPPLTPLVLLFTVVAFALTILPPMS